MPPLKRHAARVPSYPKGGTKGFQSSFGTSVALPNAKRFKETSSKRKTILMKTRKYKDNQQRKNFVQNESKMFLNQYFKKIEKDSNEKYCQ